MPHFIIDCSQDILQHFLSVNINDFEAATYSNKVPINPENTGKDRHFGL